MGRLPVGPVPPRREWGGQKRQDTRREGEDGLKRQFTSEIYEVK